MSKSNLGEKKNGRRTFLDQVLDNVLQLVFFHLQIAGHAAPSIHFLQEFHLCLLLRRDFERMLRTQRVQHVDRF